MEITTPAFVFDETQILSACAEWRSRCLSLGGIQLFPLKCNSDFETLSILSRLVDGFAVSSLFEAKLAREVGGPDIAVHYTSPGLRPDEFDDIITLVDQISFNSLSQLARFKGRMGERVSTALRINPQLSFLHDNRYDPSGPHSKLGAPIEQVERALLSEPALLDTVRCVHFHNNCDATDWQPILETVKSLASRIPTLLRRCDWVNFGGGYLLDNHTDLAPYRTAIKLLQDEFGLKVITEPGASIVRNAGVLIASVIDLFESDGAQIAVLDTTVNHVPETFEYRVSPEIWGDTEEGRHCYFLAGATCLAGDVFGEYAFDTPLELGSRITFLGVGVYAVVKSHMFNGINLPAIYSKKSSGALVLKKSSNYSDFRRMCGLGQHEAL